jgi:hypothetical protein
MLDCEICGFDGGKTIVWIKGKRNCSDCALPIFIRKWIKLKKKYTKLNKEYKSIAPYYKL